MNFPQLKFDCGPCRYVRLEHCSEAKTTFRDGKRKTFIYALVDPRDGLAFYIGRTYNPAQRFQIYDYFTRRPDQANRIGSLAVAERFQEILAADLYPTMRLLRSTTVEQGAVSESHAISRHLKLNPKLLNKAIHMNKSKAAAALGRSKSKLKRDAARINGLAGGRPRSYPQCPRYKAHRFTNDRCPCGYQRKTTKKGEHKHGTIKH